MKTITQNLNQQLMDATQRPRQRSGATMLPVDVNQRSVQGLQDRVQAAYEFARAASGARPPCQVPREHPMSKVVLGTSYEA